MPNLTEAAFMLDLPYVGGGYTVQYVQDILKRLTDLGVRRAVLTGVVFGEEKRIGVMSYDRDSGAFFSYETKRVDAVYHGTGDVFASTCVGAMARGKSLEQALTLAADYTAECIRKTVDDPESNWYGVNFEQAIPYLIDRL